jgi:hypothetical protein
MPITPLATIRKRQANKLANTNYVNEVADVVAGQSPFGTSGQTGFHAPPWQQGYPLKITGNAGHGQYKVTVGEWKPGGFTPDSDLNVDDIADFSDGISGYLVNGAENNIATNRLPADQIIAGAQLIFVHPDTDLPVFFANAARAVRFNRYNESTGEFQETYVQAATRDDVADEDWVTWEDSFTCTS